MQLLMALPKQASGCFTQVWNHLNFRQFVCMNNHANLYLFDRADTIFWSLWSFCHYNWLGLMIMSKVGMQRVADLMLESWKLEFFIFPNALAKIYWMSKDFFSGLCLDGKSMVKYVMGTFEWVTWKNPPTNTHQIIKFKISIQCKFVEW